MNVKTTNNPPLAIVLHYLLQQPRDNEPCFVLERTFGIHTTVVCAACPFSLAHDPDGCYFIDGMNDVNEFDAVKIKLPISFPELVNVSDIPEYVASVLPETTI